MGNSWVKFTQVHQKHFHRECVDFILRLVKKCCTEVKHLILGLFAWSFISISASMLMIQMELVWLFLISTHYICHRTLISMFQSQQYIDVVVLFTAVLYALIAFGVIIVACDVGQRISNAFEQIADVTNQYRWYLFPKQVKQMFPMILMNLQMPVELPIFGNFCCDRKAFKKVSKECYKMNFLWALICVLIDDSDDNSGNQDWILIFYGVAQIWLSFHEFGNLLIGDESPQCYKTSNISSVFINIVSWLVAVCTGRRTTVFIWLN